MVERYANRFDAIGLTFVEMVVAFAGFLAVALVLGDLSVPRGWTVWGALLVTGIFASALAYLIQIWAQRRISATRIALIFALEAVWAGFFGFLLAGDRLGLAGWAGCALILAGIVGGSRPPWTRCAASSGVQAGDRRASEWLSCYMAGIPSAWSARRGSFSSPW